MKPNIEIARRYLQKSLDQGKNQKERNKLGQFTTPYELALQILEYIDHTFGLNSRMPLLEPAVGTGVFFSALKEILPKDAKGMGYEIDPYYYNPSKALWEGCNFEYRLGDFLSISPCQKFPLLVSNPPYVRYQHISKEVKQELQNLVKKEFGICLSGLAGLYSYFILLGQRWLTSNGIGCWLVPSEFLDVNYGKAIKEFLTTQVSIKSIHKFDYSDIQFEDALVSSCILIYENAIPTGEEKVVFTRGKSLNEPCEKVERLLKELDFNDKWSSYFENKLQKKGGKKIRDYFYVKRGIVTGDNDFFILTPSTIKEFKIPKEFVTPLLPRPYFLPQNIVEENKGLPIVDREEFLFTCNINKETLKLYYPSLLDYIAYGESKGAHESYICSHRKPWYACEQRSPSPIVVPYMNRADSNRGGFRFILNMSKALTTNVYLLMYPKEEYEQILKDKEVLKEVWRRLNSLSQEELLKQGRVYGGGLGKIEPGELLDLSADILTDLLEPHKYNPQLYLFS
ncbi:MAG: Eco57I restriction-modification methylase domain-containing protein [Bacteroidales bacterium]|nr:Eco57I restriction-modification methylase domain-containing protein [Bacteroidales bacterium]